MPYSLWIALHITLNSVPLNYITLDYITLDYITQNSVRQRLAEQLRARCPATLSNLAPANVMHELEWGQREAPLTFHLECDAWGHTACLHGAICLFECSVCTVWIVASWVKPSCVHLGGGGERECERALLGNNVHDGGVQGVGRICFYRIYRICFCGICICGI